MCHLQIVTILVAKISQDVFFFGQTHFLMLYIWAVYVYVLFKYLSKTAIDLLLG